MNNRPVGKDKVYIQEFIKLIFKYKLALLIILAVSVGSFFELSVLIPKKYRADFEISIYPKYFKNPIINNVIPGVSSAQEMTQTVDANIKEVLNDSFMDEIASDFGFYSLDQEEMALTLSRNQFRARFKAYSTGGQSYRIDFFDSVPERALQVSELVMERVRNYFIESRIETIENVRRIMLTRLESLSVTKKIQGEELGDNVLASNSPAVLRSEIAKIDQDMSALRKQFNSNHPRVLKLLNRRATIVNWLAQVEAQQEGAADEFSDAALLMNADSEVASELSAKLYAKYHDINIALELEKTSLPSYIGIIKAPSMPTEPIWPKKRLFASIGFVIGLILCFLYVLFKEIVLLSLEEKLTIKAKGMGGLVLGETIGIDEKMLAKALTSARVREASKKSEIGYQNMLEIEEAAPVQPAQ